MFFHEKENLRAKKYNSEIQLDHGTLRSHHGDLAQSFRVEGSQNPSMKPTQKKNTNLEVFWFPVAQLLTNSKLYFSQKFVFFPLKVHHLGQEEPVLHPCVPRAAAAVPASGVPRAPRPS